MAEGIDHLLRIYGNILQSREALVVPKLHLAFLEFDKQFSVRYYEYNSDTKAVDELGIEPFGDSELSKLQVFCAFPSLPIDKLTVQFGGEKYYARPLSLWLAPVAFLLLPADTEEISEACLREHDTLLQATLSDALWRTVDEAFKPSAIAGLSDENISGDFLDSNC